MSVTKVLRRQSYLNKMGAIGGNGIVIATASIFISFAVLKIAFGLGQIVYGIIALPVGQ